jgi:hypothetical protein
METNLINEYLESWVQKRIDYELMAKGRAKLNKDCWRKLRTYHMQNYVKKLDNPFSFLFNLKFKHRELGKHIPCINTLYYKELEKRQAKFALNGNGHNPLKTKISSFAKR